MTTFSHPGGQYPGAEARVWRPAVSLAVEKIRNHHDVVPHGQHAVGLLLETLGDRRHPVRLVNRERHRFRVGVIAADERDVGPVQRGDHLRHAIGRGRLKNLPGQVGGSRMRHGVVRMDDVELELTRDLDHSRGQCQDVLSFAEQRIRRRRHPVEIQACLIGPDRNGVSALRTWTSCPRAASDFASSVATIPLPPTDA